LQGQEICVTSAASCNRLRRVSMRQVAVKKELNPASYQCTLSHLPTILQPSPRHHILQISLRANLSHPEIKMGLKGHRFASVEEIQQNAKLGLRATPVRTSRNASGNGRADGTSVRLQIGTTLRLTLFYFYIFFY
jgi:hypothetical protein